MNLAAHNLCSGCAACYAVCPRKAISMQPDEEGFLYPHIDESLCVHCGLCERVCPSLHQDPSREPQTVYAAKANDDALRLESSSGGIFSLLARRVLSQDGLVFGAACELPLGRVCHIAVFDETGLASLRGSKYVQSDVRETYHEAREALDKGKMVLFSGTPCQIAALRHYLGKDYEKLICVDLVCHAAPSPLAWKKFLEKRAAASAPGRDSARAEGPELRRIAFRRKNCGWKRYSLSLRFANDKEYRADLYTDPFLRGFLAELYNRPSCHQCKAREGRSGADITLADYWNVHRLFPEMDDDKGASLVLVHTEKGRQLWASVASELMFCESTLADAVRNNSSIVTSTKPNVRRAQFFRLLAKGRDFDWIVTRLLRRPLWRRCASKLKRVVLSIVKR